MTVQGPRRDGGRHMQASIHFFSALPVNRLKKIPLERHQQGSKHTNNQDDRSQSDTRATPSDSLARAIGQNHSETLSAVPEVSTCAGTAPSHGGSGPVQRAKTKCEQVIGMGNRRLECAGASDSGQRDEQQTSCQAT
jgi:hypothetical protein